MKKIIICIITIMLAAPCIMAQTTPQGMKYQAIARDLNGEIMPDQPIELRMTLRSNDKTSIDHYIETHRASTNKLGLFSLVIGNGDVQFGTFKDIPWSEENIWISIEIKNQDTNAYTIISNSKLLAVPYAFHATTALNLAHTDSDLRMENRVDGIRSQTWSLFGNLNTDDKWDKLGTSDFMDLKIVTNNAERLRITADGEIKTANGKFTVGGNLEVLGDSTTINKDLFVGRNVYLNDNDEFDPRGETINYGKFTVKDSTYLEANLTVVANVEDGGYLATFENINENDGDGINIKLGKTHPGWDGSAYINATNPVVEYFDVNIQNIRDAVTGADEFTYTDALSLMPYTIIRGTACGLLEKLVEDLNERLGLPYDVVIPALCVTVDYEVDEITVCVPGFSSPTELLTIDAIPDDFCGDLPMLSMPNISFVNVTNSLTNDNHYIDFTDKDNKSLGSIRAVSITEWGNNYFDGVWLTGFIQKSVGIDPLDALTGLVNVASTIVDDYNHIGVEYTSGNGDYAEWLERLDPNEFISKGDIVGVIGGKITKDLENAEQIMAVSEQPIMLGNIPEKSKEFLGNNIAFMGQIPVKVIGEVNSGDYIIADTKVPGYGIAKNPSDVTIDDTKFIVGRSWETNLNSGPKMVNTVIGVHNGDYLKIIKKVHTEFEQAKKRLDNLESKVDELINNSSINDSSLNN